MNDEKKTILITTAFPIHGAGSGILVTTQAKSYAEAGYRVVIITGDNRTDFEGIEGVEIHVVPFTAETENPEKMEGQLPFNYPVFTTHVESSANYWNIGLVELEQCCKAFKNAVLEDVKKYNPFIILAQHNWVLSSEDTRMGVPVVTTIHGTDLMGYEKTIEALKTIQEEIDKIKQKPIFEKLSPIFNNSTLSFKEIIETATNVVNSLENEKDKEFAKKAVELLSEQTKYKFYKNEAENSAKNF